MQTQTKTVVVVEDSAAVRERLRTLLSETPGIVLVAEYDNVEQATTGMALVAPDAAVVDIRLGHTYSMELVRFLKQRHPQTIVIMYSNYADAAHRQAYLQAGADLFFDKTSETEQLLAALARLSTH
jgi:DNA-binding NarL/FixJ family response regulator